MIRFRNFILMASLLCLFSACSVPLAGPDVIYQTSTLHALLEGVYDGDLAVGELKGYGDMGIGTFNALDGEMVVVDGKCFKVPASGKVVEVPDSEKTPFASVTHFDADRVLVSPSVDSYETFSAWLDQMIVNKNVPVAIRVDGVFEYMKTRSVPRQSKPYPRLAKVTENQPTFEFEQVAGTIVGFRLPPFLNGVNLSGYHMHFITADRTGGGHILNFKAKDLRVTLDPSAKLHLVLPEAGAFARAALDTIDQDELKKVEQDR